MRFIVVLGLCLTAVSVCQGQSSEEVFPIETKGYLSIVDGPTLRKHYEQTSFAQLVKDPQLKPIREELKRLFQTKLGGRLNAKWSDLKEIASGEIATGLVRPQDKLESYAYVLMVDVKGNENRVAELLTKLAGNVRAKGGNAAKRTGPSTNLAYTELVLPENENRTRKLVAFYRLVKSKLLAADELSILETMTARVAGTTTKEDMARTLSAAPAFAANKKYLAGKAMGTPDLSWFIEPIAYARAARAAAGTEEDGHNLDTLSSEGFQEIKGITGHLRLAQGDMDATHLIKVHAKTPLPKGAGVMDFPNGPGALLPEPFVPADVDSYLSFRWEMAKAFERAIPMINKFLGALPNEDLVKEIIDGIRDEEGGPRVDIRKEIVANLGSRATWIVKHRRPITPQSERWLMLVETNKVEVVAKAFKRILDLEMNTRPIKIGNHAFWEVLEVEDELTVKGLDIDEDFVTDSQDQEAERLFVVGVIKDAAKQIKHICVASDAEFVKVILNNNKPLSAAEDFKRQEASNKFLVGEDLCMRRFSRLAQVHETTYELVRQGKMPEAKSILGRMLNSMMTSDEEEDEPTQRKQVIKGQKLPPFAKLQPYLGTTGFYAKSEKDGWFISSGALRPK